MPPITGAKKASKPAVRRLRAFAFDPTLNTRLETAVINQVTLKIPWEADLRAGPAGEYLEVVDVDPASGLVYSPVDLDNPYLLATDGLAPSEGTPQFHQQMVYAVAMTTIRHFEEALGRRALWSPHTYKDEQGHYHDDFIRRLRIYPHAMREANAYYSPNKKALLFGYFPASTTDPGDNLPGGMVFTCLSHDIVAHECTHALLDGMHRRFIEPSNVDVLAFHEAFADIVALFQHFSYPEVLHNQIARTRGNLADQNLLAQLAQQFGQAIGTHGALRDALGQVDKKTGQWKPSEPDPTLIQRVTEPHARGSILVAAVFDAFLSIYKSRVADLLRIATGGSGVLPQGEIHPDLVERLAQEASKSSRHVLHMCIRALDYCPPVDINFGDYLRALITADRDLVPLDEHSYRIAFVEAFRRRGIYPLDVRSLSEESLLWQAPDLADQQEFRKALRGLPRLRRLVPNWGMKSDRQTVFNQTLRNQGKLHGWFTNPPLPSAARAVGLVLQENAPLTIYRKDNLPALEVHSVRPALRVGPTGVSITDLVIEMTQRRRAYLDPAEQEKADKGDLDKPPDFIFRGGCTLLIDLETGDVRYSIGKSITSSRRLESQRRFLDKPYNPSLRATYFGDPRRYEMAGPQAGILNEPLALLHHSYDDTEVD